MKLQDKLLKHLELLPSDYDKALHISASLLAYVCDYNQETYQDFHIEDDTGLNIDVKVINQSVYKEAVR